MGWAERNKNQSSKSENKGMLRRYTTHLRGYFHGVMISLWHLRSVGIKNKLPRLAPRQRKRRLVGAGIERMKIAFRTICAFRQLSLNRNIDIRLVGNVSQQDPDR